MILSILLPCSNFGASNEAVDSNPQVENPKISWPDSNRDRDRRQVGLGSLSHDGSHTGDHGDMRHEHISVSDGSRTAISSPNRNNDQLVTRRQYPNRNYDQSYGQSRSFGNAQQFNDPSSVFRQQSKQSSVRQKSDGSFPYDPYGPNRGNTSYSSRGRNVQPQRKAAVQPQRKAATTTRRPAKTKRGGGNVSTRSPFEDPDRYRVPQLEQAADNVRFVNGRPYR